jgi:hypothetical protein
MLVFIKNHLKIISSKIQPEPKPNINWENLSTSEEDYLLLKKHKYNIDWAEFAKNPNSINLYLKLLHDNELKEITK